MLQSDFVVALAVTEVLAVDHAVRGLTPHEILEPPAGRRIAGSSNQIRLFARSSNQIRSFAAPLKRRFTVVRQTRALDTVAEIGGERLETLGRLFVTV